MYRHVSCRYQTEVEALREAVGEKRRKLEGEFRRRIGELAVFYQVHLHFRVSVRACTVICNLVGGDVQEQAVRDLGGEHRRAK